MRFFVQYKVRHYEPGDQVFLFGFSRGAYTARALAGMLYKCGLLQDGCYNLLPSVSELYHTHNNDALAAQFKAIFSQACKPHFIGVWDTVKSLGYFLGKSFFNTRLNPDIKFAYHAIAIDERRKKFQVCLWDETAKAPRQTIEQVWFSGAHSDVGGRYEERGLSDISLAWLLQKAQEQGLLLENNWQQTLNQDPLTPMHDESRKGIWKLWRPVTRQIPEQALIHQSVIKRMEKLAEYQPKLPSSYTGQLSIKP